MYQKMFMMTLTTLIFTFLVINYYFGINHLSDSDNEVKNNILAPDSDADEQSGILTLNSNIDVQDELLISNSRFRSGRVRISYCNKSKKTC